MSIPTTVRIDGERVFLNELLGQGSMGSVYKAKLRGKDVAAKIYVYDGDPDKEKMRKVRADKIPRMVQMTLPDLVLPPQHVITDDVGEFLGYTMPLLPKGYVPLAELYSKNFWARQLITPAKALEILRGVRDFVATVHKADLVICDFNPGNAMFHISQLGKILGCDVDSYQIPGFNGREIHFAYGSPRTYNKDCGAGAFQFLPEDDLWSLYVHYVTGMTRGNHPFRGKGEWFKKTTAGMEVPERVLAGISIFDQRVEAIGGAFPIVILPDEVLHHLQEVLIKQKKVKGPMPDFLFDLVFRTCSKCKNDHARKVCPICSQVVFVPTTTPVTTIEYIPSLYTTGHSIVASAMVGGAVLLVIREPEKFRTVKIALDGKVIHDDSIPLAIDPAEEYAIDIGQEHIGIADSAHLVLFNHLGKEVERTTTNTFLRKPTFAVSDTLYRTVGAQVSRWETVAGKRIYKPVIQGLPIGAVWLEGTAAGLVFMTYVTGRYGWELLQGASRKKIPVQAIPKRYFLVTQHTAAPDAKSLAIFRVIEDPKGSQRTLVDLVDTATMQVQSTEHDGTIHQAATMGGTILFASDEGLMTWKQGQKPALRDGTQNAVQGGDSIFLADAGTIVVVRNNAVSLLRAKTK